MLPALIIDRQPQIDALCREHHVVRLELFGSAATGEWDADRSDLDFLVEFDDQARWATQIDLEAALRNLFKREVDLIDDVDFENPYFRQSVEDSRTHLWGEPRRAPSWTGVRVSEHQALKYLWDIRREIGYLDITIAGLDLETVLVNITLLRSFQMHLMVIGEALKQLSSADHDVYSRITGGSGYIGQRNVLIHQYSDIKWDRIWDSVQNEIPLLLEEVTAVIEELDPQERRD